jgi:hypothetical protein
MRNEQERRTKNFFYYLFCCCCCKQPLTMPQSPPITTKKIEIITKKDNIKLEVLIAK